MIAPGLEYAINLIEKRRQTYISENCGHANDGHWWGTTAQEEYVGELDDIIEMLRREQEGQAEASSSPVSRTCSARKLAAGRTIGLGVRNER